MEPLSVDRWDESLAHIVWDMNGQPLNVHKLMANHPRLLEAWWRFRNYAVTGGDLDQRQCELVILRVATHMKAWYEWASHVDRGLKSRLTLGEIERVKAGPGHPDWAVADSVLLRAVDDCVVTHQILPKTLLELGKHFTGRQIMDIIVIHGMYVTLGIMINTWGLELDPHIQLPDGVSKSEWDREYCR